MEDDENEAHELLGSSHTTIIFDVTQDYRD